MTTRKIAIDTRKIAIDVLRERTQLAENRPTLSALRRSLSSRTLRLGTGARGASLCTCNSGMLAKAVKLVYELAASIRGIFLSSGSGLMRARIQGGFYFFKDDRRMASQEAWKIISTR